MAAKTFKKKKNEKQKLCILGISWFVKKSESQVGMK